MQAAKRAKFILEALFRPNERPPRPIDQCVDASGKLALFRPIFSSFRPHPQIAQRSFAHTSVTPLPPVTYSPLRHYVTSPYRLTATSPHIQLATPPPSRISISPLAQAFQYPHCHDASPPEPPELQFPATSTAQKSASPGPRPSRDPHRPID